jgi:hypothetical protein
MIPGTHANLSWFTLQKPPAKISGVPAIIGGPLSRAQAAMIVDGRDVGRAGDSAQENVCD